MRLSQANYYESANWILQLIGCSNKQHIIFVDGESEPTKLSRLTGINDGVFQSKAFEAYRARDFIRYHLAQKATHLCPECLKESPHARFIWDCEIDRVCPIHRCNLVNKCYQCSQTIKWLRPGVTECKCGFDFRDSTVTNATDSQVNFALYRSGCFGNGEHMKSVKAIYGEDNPLFCLTFKQFEQMTNFFKLYIKQCLRHKADAFASSAVVPTVRGVSPALVMSRDVLTKFRLESKLLSSEELVFDFFQDWKRNINYLFQWHENNPTIGNSTASTISSTVFRLVELSSLLPINSFLSKQLEIALKKYLYDRNVIQIEIGYRYLDDYYGEKLDLNRIEYWLPRMSKMLDCPELTLTRLIWVCQHVKSIHWLKDCSAWQIFLNRPLTKLVKSEDRFF